jgi:succinate dehydrogenase flavin-adding protein (antitoxin of CptAB toxin-antitoxin module)
MKELDLLLLPYLERVYPTAGAAARAAFRRLLEESDAALWQYFSAGPPPEDAELADTVRAVRRAAAPGP